MTIDPVISFSFTSFRPFVTEAFNSRPGLAPIEISDRSQLRKLLKEKRMCEMGDSTSYFGSNPKSVPTFQEITKHGKVQDEEAMKRRAELVHVSPDPVGDMQKIDLAADQTDFGRRQTATRPEFVVGRP